MCLSAAPCNRSPWKNKSGRIKAQALSLLCPLLRLPQPLASGLFLRHPPRVSLRLLAPPELFLPQKSALPRRFLQASVQTSPFKDAHPSLRYAALYPHCPGPHSSAPCCGLQPSRLLRRCNLLIYQLCCLSSLLVHAPGTSVSLLR